MRSVTRVGRCISRFLIERALRANRFDSTWQHSNYIRIGSRSSITRYSSRKTRRRHDVCATSAVWERALFSAWHQRILLVTEQACAVNCLGSGVVEMIVPRTAMKWQCSSDAIYFLSSAFNALNEKRDARFLSWHCRLYVAVDRARVSAHPS